MVKFFEALRYKSEGRELVLEFFFDIILQSTPRPWNCLNL